MNVAILLWPITMEGGLATRALHTHRLLVREGHKPVFFRLVYSDAKHKKGAPEPTVGASRYGLSAAQWHLSITDKKIGETLSVLDAFDMLMFLHAAPHVGEKQKAIKNWPLVYTEPHGRKLTYFSDQFAADLYPWITDVADRFEPVGINPPAAAHAEKLLGRPVRVAPMPFVYDPVDDLDAARDRLVLWTSGWRRSKGIMRFIGAAPKIDGDVRVYGIGRDLDAFKKTDEYGPVESMIQGAVTPDVIERDLRAASISCDFTGQSAKYVGHYNRATIEPMLLGAVSAVLPSMTSPNSPIPEDAVLVVDPDDVAGSVNDLLADPVRARALARRGHDFARAHFDPTRTLAAILG